MMHRLLPALGVLSWAATATAQNAPEGQPGATPTAEPAVEPAVEPEDDEPDADLPAPPPQPVADAGYPTAIAARPLLLPNGVFEAGVRLQTFSYSNIGGGSVVPFEAFDFIYADLAVRAGLGALELRAEAGLLAKQPDELNQDALYRLAVGGATGVGHGGVAVKATFYSPQQTDFSYMTLEAAALSRWRASPHTALQGGLGVRADLIGGQEGIDDTHIVWVEGLGLGQVQMDTQLALEGSARLSVPVADNYEIQDYPSTLLSVGLRGLYTTRALDFYLGLEISPFYSQISQRLFSAGVVGRLL